MHQNHRRFLEPFGAGRTDVILIEVVQHGTTHVTADLGGGLQRKYHDRHDHLHELHLKAGPVGYHMGGVID